VYVRALMHSARMVDGEPMMYSTMRTLILGGLLIAAPAFSDPPPNAQAAPSAPATVEPSPPAKDANKTPPKPSAEILKKARLAGMHTEVRNGVTMFCKEDTDLGSRFKTKKCVDENQFIEALEQQQANRDTLSRQDAASLRPQR
jgi:hypothetical protein